jgi:7-cyano-7-deazaguanine synthase
MADGPRPRHTADGPGLRIVEVHRLSHKSQFGTTEVVGDRDPVAVLLSGGIDSAILVGEQLRKQRTVVPIHVRTGCFWDACEFRAVTRFLAAIDQPNLEPLVSLSLPLADLYADHWSMTGRAVPDETTPDDAVFLPGRNPLLLIKPLIWCVQNEIRELAIATLSSNPFDDATPRFFARFESLIQEATGRRVQIARPFEHLSKAAVMGLAKDIPLEATFSCLSPKEGLHCGRCNKCAERQAAFGRVSGRDPTIYAATIATV